MQLSLVQLHLHFRAIFNPVKSVQITAHIVIFFFICRLCSTLGTVFGNSFYHYYTTWFTFSVLGIFLISSPKNMINRGRVRVLSSSNLLSVLCEQHSLELLLPSCNENPHITCQQSELYCARFTLPVTLNHPGQLSFLHLTFECNLKTLGINTPNKPKNCYYL